MHSRYSTIMLNKYSFFFFNISSQVSHMNRQKIHKASFFRDQKIFGTEIDFQHCSKLVKGNFVVAVVARPFRSLEVEVES